MTTPTISTDLLYLSRSDLIELGGGHSQPYVDAIVDGLAAHVRGEYVQPLKPYLRWPGADHIADRIIAMPCYLGDEQAMAGLKWIGSRQHNPARFGLERASALVVLNDAQTNYPIAIMEGGLISGMRTAAITAVAARHLALDNFTDVAVIGCGPIARMQVHDGRACFRRADGGIRDLLGRDGQVRRHRGRMDRARDGAGDDDFAGFRHGYLLYVIPGLACTGEGRCGRRHFDCG
mgnify:CR=1 FL=1